MYILLIGILLTLFGVLAWQDFKFALTLLIALLPTYLVRFDLGIPWTLLEGFILTLFVIWFFKQHGRRLKLQSFGPYRAPLFLLLALTCFSAIWAPDLYAALGLWKAYFVEPLMVFAMLRSTFTERADWLRALHYLGVTVVVISVFAIMQKLTGYGIPIPWDVDRRATSLFEYPNAVGLFVAPIASAVLVLSSPFPSLPGGVQKGGWRYLLLAIAAMGLVAIVLAETEAALVAIPAALLLTLFISKATMKIKVAVGLIAIVIGALAFAAVPVVREKLLLQDYSGQVRLSQWRETIDMLQDKPLQGAGLAGYPTVFAPYHNPTLYEIFQYPHNVILNAWVELGIFGFFAMLGMIVAVGFAMRGRRDDALALAAFAALATMFIHGLVDVPFFKNDLAVLTVFFLAMTLPPSLKDTSSSLS